MGGSAKALQLRGRDPSSIGGGKKGVGAPGGAKGVTEGELKVVKRGDGGWLGGLGRMIGKGLRRGGAEGSAAGGQGGGAREGQGVGGTGGGAPRAVGKATAGGKPTENAVANLLSRTPSLAVKPRTFNPDPDPKPRTLILYPLP